MAGQEHGLAERADDRELVLAVGDHRLRYDNRIRRRLFWLSAGAGWWRQRPVDVVPISEAAAESPCADQVQLDRAPRRWLATVRRPAGRDRHLSRTTHRQGRRERDVTFCGATYAARIGRPPVRNLVARGSGLVTAVVGRVVRARKARAIRSTCSFPSAAFRLSHAIAPVATGQFQRSAPRDPLRPEFFSLKGPPLLQRHGTPARGAVILDFQGHGTPRFAGARDPLGRATGEVVHGPSGDGAGRRREDRNGLPGADDD